MGNEKQLLKKIGEETLYSAKGHFKASDFRRNLITGTLWFCAIFSVLDLMNIWPSLGTWFDGVGILGTIALLIWNEGEGKNYSNRHKKVGEEYLALHKEIRECYFIETCSSERVKELSEKVRLLDQSDKPEISGVARWWAQKSIEKYDETDNWFLTTN